MEKTRFKITSVLLAFTMLFSTLSFSVNKHYCGDTLFNKSIFFHSQDCGMPNMDLNDTKNPFSKTIRNNSCHNVRLFVKGQNLEQKALSALTLEVNQVAVIIDFKSFNFESDYIIQPNFYQDYAPPFLVKNIPILVQNFRI